MFRRSLGYGRSTTSQAIGANICRHGPVQKDREVATRHIRHAATTNTPATCCCGIAVIMPEVSISAVVTPNDARATPNHLGQLSPLVRGRLAGVRSPIRSVIGEAVVGD